MVLIFLDRKGLALEIALHKIVQEGVSNHKVFMGGLCKESSDLLIHLAQLIHESCGPCAVGFAAWWITGAENLCDRRDQTLKGHRIGPNVGVHSSPAQTKK